MKTMMHVIVTKKGLNWLDKEDKKLDTDENVNCWVMDLLDIIHANSLEMISPVTAKKVSMVVKPIYDELYGDKCYPNVRHVAWAFRKGFIGITP
jgi:hypothetical protein